jgi:hypothetical protein
VRDGCVPTHNQRLTDQGHGRHDARAKNVPPGAVSRLTLTMIIVSEPSAKATQPVRTGRYTPTRRRSSAACNNTPRYADGRPISVHTEEVNRSRSAVSGLRRALLRDGPGLGTKVGGHPGRGYPVASAPRRSRSGVGSSSFSASGALAGPRPRPASRQARRRDEIPTSVPLSSGGLTPRVCH